MFNANPLMRFDGYYILADWLEIPNLREKANRFLNNLFLDKCLGIEVPPEAYMAPWRKWLFVVYAIASWVYRWVVMFGILWFLSDFLGPKLKILSQMLAVMSLASLFVWPTYRVIKNIRQRGRLPDMKAHAGTTLHFAVWPGSSPRSSCCRCRSAAFTRPAWSRSIPRRPKPCCSPSRHA